MSHADGFFIEDSIMLEALANSSEPPTDVKKAAELLRCWMHPPLGGKPKAHFECTYDSAGFLDWVSRNVGDKAYKLIKQRHPEEAAEIRRQVLVICFMIQNRCERLSGPSIVPSLGKKHAEAVRMLPEQILGVEDAPF